MVSKFQKWENTKQSAWCERNCGQDWKTDTTDEE